MILRSEDQRLEHSEETTARSSGQKLGTELEEEQWGERRRQIHDTVVDLEHGVFKEAGGQYDCCASGSEDWMVGVQFCPKSRKVGRQVMFENI